MLTDACTGDFVDRGAWGVEVLALLMAYKWLLPHNVYLIRGNHESNIITQMYGFAAELKAKYGKSAKVNRAGAVVACIASMLLTDSRHCVQQRQSVAGLCACAVT